MVMADMGWDAFVPSCRCRLFRVLLEIDSNDHIQPVVFEILAFASSFLQMLGRDGCEIDDHRKGRQFDMYVVYFLRFEGVGRLDATYLPPT